MLIMCRPTCDIKVCKYRPQPATLQMDWLDPKRLQCYCYTSSVDVYRSALCRLGNRGSDAVRLRADDDDETNNPASVWSRYLCATMYTVVCIRTSIIVVAVCINFRESIIVNVVHTGVVGYSAPKQRWCLQTLLALSKWNKSKSRGRYYQTWRGWVLLSFVV